MATQKKTQQTHVSSLRVLEWTLMGSWFLRDLLYSGLMYIAIRVLTTFAFSELNDRSWSLDWYNDWLPIIAFRTDVETYTIINSNSTVATAVILALITLGKIHRYRKVIKDRPVDWHVESGVRNRATAWAIVTIITAPQMLVALVVNRWNQIEVSNNVYLTVVLISIITALVYYAAFLRSATQLANSKEASESAID